MDWSYRMLATVQWTMMLAGITARLERIETYLIGRINR
jgi:hypothetical protein